MMTITKAEYDAFIGLQSENMRLSQQINYLLEQVRLSRHRQFGASSEKSEYDCEQLNLFNEVEFFSEPQTAEPELHVIERHYRKKQRELPSKLPEDLPVEVVEHILPDAQQSCPACHGPLHVIGKEVVSRGLKLIPAKAVIIENVQYVYACRNCEKAEVSVPVVKAPLPKSVIPGSFATPEAIAHIATQKFIMGLPLYRQEQEWKRQGIELSRQTMSNWLLKATKDWLEPIYELLKERLLKQKVLHADETTLQVLKEPGKTAQSKSYMWLYRTSGDVEHPIVLYEYQPDRKSQRVKDFLGEFRGYLHTDGYAGYHSLPEGITVVGCWAHARRKFDEALKVLAEKDRKTSAALVGKAYCDRLFELERRLAELPAKKRFEERQVLAKPVLDEFLSWLNSLNAGKSALGKAARYTLDQWRYLERYLLDGRLEISNNRAERSIKPFVIGRKNFLFCNVPKGAKASAILYSIVETAKENDLNPYEYLALLFRKLPNQPVENWKNLLPGECKVPESCVCPKPKTECYAWEEDK